MKALTLTQPWAALVALGLKQIETRSWSTKYRGSLYIHAAKGYPRPARDFAGELWAEGLLPPELPLGMLVATARLVGVETTTQLVRISSLELRFGDYGPERYAWFLEDIKPLPEPIPWKGMLGLFNVEL